MFVVLGLVLLGWGEAIDLCGVLWCCLARELLNAVLSFLRISGI